MIVKKLITVSISSLIKLLLPHKELGCIIYQPDLIVSDYFERANLIGDHPFPTIELCESFYQAPE